MVMQEDFSTEETLAYGVGLVGGVNWLLVDSAGINLATEIGVVGAGLVYTAIGIAAAASLADMFDLIELSEVFGDS